MAYRLPHWAKGRTGLWHPAFPEFGIDEGDDFNDLAEFFAWIENGGLVEAHNAFFERGIWTNIMVPKLAWPVIGSHQWRCSAAKAAAHSLPRALKDAGKALNIEVRKDDSALRTALDLDDTTVRAMTKISKPRKPRKDDRIAWNRLHAPCLACNGVGRVPSLKKDGTPTKKGMKCAVCEGTGARANATLPPMPILYHESREVFQELWNYCRGDVLAEEAFSEELPDLSDDETEMYLLDQRINERGFYVDLGAVDTALALVDEEFADLNTELAGITGGAVLKATQRAKMIDWLAEQGLELDNTQADTLDEVLEGDSQSHSLQPPVRRALEIMRALGKSSTAKYEAMRDWACPDSRIRGGLLYHGASTGRWTGKGVQPHNFPKGELDEDVADPDFIWAMLDTRDREAIADTFGTVMTALSSGLRGAITAEPGKTLYVADFSNIESRVLQWVAGDEEALQMFRDGVDPYNDMASFVYKRPINRKVDKVEGQIGKVAVLGLGFQMGASKFVDTVKDWTGIDIIEDVLCQRVVGKNGAHCCVPSAKHRDEGHDFVFAPGEEDLMTGVKVVNAYRTKYRKVKQLWQDQEAAAIKAVLNPHRKFTCSVVSWFMEGDFLYCELPSGRRLAYPEPAIVDKPVPWGGTKPSLTYMGVDAYTRKWKRQSAYGGLLVENIVQAIARDLMAAALMRCEQSGTYVPILSVHDEALAEALMGTGSVPEFVALIALLPDWAEGCPVTADGWTGVRYRK